MAEVHDTLIDPSGEPIEGAEVRVALIAGTPPGPGLRPGSESAVLGQWTTHTGEDGRWSVDLAPNSSFTPDNTYYRGHENGNLVYFVVPDTAGPHWVHAIRISEPPPMEALQLHGDAQHSVDYAEEAEFQSHVADFTTLQNEAEDHFASGALHAGQMAIQDEGISIGTAGTINYEGNGVNAAVANDVLTVQVIGTHIFEQVVPSDEWVISHPLNRFPAVTVIDSAGSEVVGDVEYVSPLQVIARFSGSFAGTAYLT